MTIKLLHRPNYWLLVIAAGVILGVVLVGGLVLWRHTHSYYRAPKSITQQLLFPVYNVGYLPPGFSVDQNSFSVTDHVLIFQALNAGSTNIAITEEANPPKFDFTGFYDKNFTGIKNLQGQTPYTTVTGKLQNGRHAISIETSTTWIIMTTEVNLSTDQAALIAKHLQRP